MTTSESFEINSFSVCLKIQEAITLSEVTSKLRITFGKNYRLLNAI